MDTGVTVEVESVRERIDDIGVAILAAALTHPDGNDEACVELRCFGGARGRGLVIRRPISAGDVVLRDRPIVAMQQDFSRRLSPACERCCKMVGDLDMHVRRILQNGPLSLAAFPRVAQNPVLRHHGLNLGPAPIPCQTEGCDALFCSFSCRDAELTQGCHRVLCSDLSNDRARSVSWARFQAHARRHHENFLLAARAYALIINRVVYHDTPVRLAMADLLANQHAPWQSLPATQRGVHSHAFANGCNQLGHIDKISVQKRLHALRESLELLTAALLPAYRSRAPGLDELFKMEYYAELLGQFDLVNVSIEYAHPSEDVIATALDNPVDELHGFARILLEDLAPELQRIIGCHPAVDLDAKARGGAEQDASGLKKDNFESSVVRVHQRR